jgi:uncharacterized glyoxalase superfamily protein PhnB
MPIREIAHMDNPTFTASVFYEDPKAALAWLIGAFGFEITMAIDGPPESPEMCHYEMALEGDGRLMVGGQWTEATRSPRGLGGANTQSLHVQLAGGLHKHCARARAAGAIIAQEPADQFYGDRTYRAVDIEGHLWTFAEHVRDVSRAEAEVSIGQPIMAADWA